MDSLYAEPRMGYERIPAYQYCSWHSLPHRPPPANPYDCLWDVRSSFYGWITGPVPLLDRTLELPHPYRLVVSIPWNHCLIVGLHANPTHHQQILWPGY